MKYLVQVNESQIQLEELNVSEDRRNSKVLRLMKIKINKIISLQTMKYHILNFRSLTSRILYL